MKKTLLLLWALVACMQPAQAALRGWYDLDITWQAGQFHGQFYFDEAVPGNVAQVSGTVHHIGRSFAVDSVLFATDPDQTFVHNSNPLEIVGYDAGFYLNVLRQGTTLTLDLSKDSGLYDWSNDLAYYPALDQSALLSWNIAQPVPEPATAAMLLLGLATLGAMKRRLS